jgi:tetratricopeptide (TPR) repeat protein
MSRKKGGRNQGSKSGAGRKVSRQDVEKLTEEHCFSEALHYAKALIQRENTPEHRVLLERTAYGRAEELCHSHDSAAAVKIIDELLKSEITHAGTLHKLVLLLPGLGRSEQAWRLAERIESPGIRQALTVKVADQAVLHPEQNVQIPEELRRGAQTIRAALKMLDEANADQAIDQLREIPRQSPFADWRLFLRGLAALRAGDHANAIANWDRLEAARPCHRIASQLRGTPPTAPDGASAGHATAVLEKRLYGEAILEKLWQLQSFLEETCWDDALVMIHSLQMLLPEIDSWFCERLTDIVLQPIVNLALNDEISEPAYLISKFMHATRPPRLDPRWNRFQAVVTEAERDDLEGAIKHWKKYSADLENLEILPVEERRAMRAIVLRHIGELYAILAMPDDDDFADEFSYRPRRRRKSTQKLEQHAIQSIEDSLRIDPSQKESYELLIDMLDRWNQTDKSATVTRRLLEVFPDDVDHLMKLTEFHLRKDQPVEALPLVEQARRLKPLDQGIWNRELSARHALARHHALAGRWDEGRAELDRVAAGWPDSHPRSSLLAKQVAFACKAAQIDEAEGILRADLTAFDDETAFWLAMSIEAARYKLAPEFQNRFAERLKTGMAAKVRTSTAARLCNILAMMIHYGIEYPGRDQHIRDVISYLKRAIRSKFTEAELIEACQFAEFASAAKRLLPTLIRQGIRHFPNSPQFLYYGAKAELEKGPFRGDLADARQKLERALEILQKAEGDGNSDLEELIKQTLSIARSLREPEFPFGELPHGMSPELFEMMKNVFFDGPHDEDESDGGPSDPFSFFGFPSQPRSRRGRR